MQSSLTFSIGIPAFNEAANIGRLLSVLLAQKYSSGRLEEILVISDGSSDQTVREVKKVSAQQVRVIAAKSQLGQATRQNQMFEESQADVLILLNADILPTSEHFIEEMLKPFIADPSIGLVGAKVTPVLKNGTIISDILNWNTTWKTELFEQINSGDNIFLCHGRARAFSKKLYKQLRWPQIQGEDAYSYVYAKTNGFAFAYAPNAAVWYASPKTLADHIKQSERFMYTIGEVSAEAEEINSQTKNWYYIPKSLLLKELVSGFVSNPLYFVGYCMILSFVLVNRLWHTNAKRSAAWAASTSTKQIVLDE